ncbi:helix-turn-helix domain-containing protein [Dyella kyungheensis]|uniref:helix-turn-helix domain-containing protein n=1 Tax=Dyella kyungheensis TaxID=1242174 RepID=UPI003CEC6FE5
MRTSQKRQRPAATGRQGKANNIPCRDLSTANAQRQQILSCLRRGSIDTLAARRELGVLMPATRVKELREAGHNIVTRLVDLPDDQGRTHRRIAMYTLIAGSAK